MGIIVQELDGSVVAKLNWSMPKDANWVLGDMCCRSARWVDGVDGIALIKKLFGNASVYKASFLFLSVCENRISETIFLQD